MAMTYDSHDTLVIKSFEEIYQSSIKKFNIDLNLRPQNLEPEMYFKLTKEFECLRR